MKKALIIIIIICLQQSGFSQEIDKNFFFLGCTSEISSYSHNKLFIKKPKVHLVLDESDTCKRLAIEKILAKKFQPFNPSKLSNYIELKSPKYNRLIRSNYKTFKCYDDYDNIHYWVYGIDTVKANTLTSLNKLSYLIGSLLMYGSIEDGICTIKMGNSKNKYLFILSIIKSNNYKIIESSINKNKVPTIYRIQFVPDEELINFIDSCLNHCIP